MAAEFLSKQLGYKICYISKPGWVNHKLIFLSAGFDEIRYYKYWKRSTRTFDFAGMLEDLGNAPEHTAVVFHSCAHNPTGCDPTQEQWKQIANVVKKKKMFPVLDSAFHGMASGDLDKDAFSVRYFASNGFEFFCVQSFAKNFAIYNERVGSLICVVNDSKAITNIKSQFVPIVRGLYSNPPVHGARIVTYILTDQHLRDEWIKCVRRISLNIVQMRRSLREALERLGTPGNWEHITAQTGLFSYMGLTEQQSLYLTKVYHIYMLRCGRMDLSGLTAHNIDYIAKGIYDAVTTLPALKQPDEW